MTAINTTSIIDKLKNLDLSKYPYNDVHNLISQLSKVAVMEFILHRGKTITRARFEMDYNRI